MSDRAPHVWTTEGYMFIGPDDGPYLCEASSLPPSDRPLRILVCGSRTWTDRDQIRARLEALVPCYRGLFEPTPIHTIIHGDAKGADKLAGKLAVELDLWVEEYPADWKRHGKAAGPIRNREMLDTGIDLVLAFQRNGSRGTQDTIDEARRRGIPVEVHSQ